MTELGLEDLAATCLAVAYASNKFADMTQYFEFPIIERRLRERLGSDEVSAILRERSSTTRAEATTMFLSSVRHLDS